MRNHSLYFVHPSSCTLSQLIPEISKGYKVMVKLGLVFVSTDIVKICVHVHILRILFFMCPNLSLTTVIFERAYSEQAFLKAG